MDKDIEQKLADIAISPYWRSLKMLLGEEIEKICDIEKISSFEELAGAKFCKKVFLELVRKIEGAKDALTFLEK